MHAALRQVLGPNAVQAGSLNRPGYLRFDFNWQGALSEDQRTQIEEVTNEAVEADYEVHSFTTELEKAKSMGAMALFGEAYPDEVRVVEIGGPFSLELCGGTHVRNSAQIGPVTILGESSVGSGVRRVEAYVGLDSFRHLAKERALMAGLASSLKVPSEEVPARVAQLVDRLKSAEKELDRMRLANARAAAVNAAAGAEQIGKVRLVAQRMAAGTSAADLRSLVGDIRGKIGSDPAVIALIAEGDNDTVPFVVAVNPAAQDLGLKANELVKQLGAAVNGRGGGKADLAQGSGKGADGHRRRTRRAARRDRPELATWPTKSTVCRIVPEATIPDGAGGLGVDVGSVRIGVAVSDPDGILATPVETVRRDRTDRHVRRLVQLVTELEVVEVVVGLPRTLADRTGPSAEDAIAVAEELATARRTRSGAVGRRTPDHRECPAVAAGSRSAGQGTASGDRPGSGRRHPAELAGPAAGHPR